MNKFLKTLQKNAKSLKNNQSGFTFVELLVVIVIMAVLVAGTANYLFGQGGSKARDVERKNEVKQVSALLEQFVSSYGEPPNKDVKSRKIKERASECGDVEDYPTLMNCFKTLNYLAGEGLINVAEDPKQDIENDEGNAYQYLYGADNNTWKVCALLENQTDPDLNDSYSGSGEYGEEGARTYCLVSTNRKLTDMTTIAGGEIEADSLMAD